MTTDLLPKCPRHPDAEVGMSEEHVFCLEDGCEWEEELCWAEGRRHGGWAVEPGTPPPPCYHCLKPYGHEGHHASFGSEGEYREWRKEFVGVSHSPIPTLYEQLYKNYKIQSPPIDELLKVAELQAVLSTPPPMIKIDSLASMTGWLDGPKTTSGLMTLKERATSKALVFDTETTDRTKPDMWDLKLSPSGDIKFIDHDAVFFYEHYKRSTLAALGIPKNVMCLHDEIRMDLTEAELRIINAPIRLEPPDPKLEAAVKLETRIEKNRLKKFHCTECGRQTITKFGTRWCQKCDKAVRDPDKR